MHVLLKVRSLHTDHGRSTLIHKWTATQLHINFITWCYAYEIRHYLKTILLFTETNSTVSVNNSYLTIIDKFYCIITQQYIFLYQL